MKFKLCPIVGVLISLVASMAPASAQILAISRDANRALVFVRTSDEDHPVIPEIWSLKPWKRRLRLQIPTPISHYHHLALSRDGKLAAIGRWDGTIEIFDSLSGRLWKRLRAHQRPRDEFGAERNKYLVRTLDFSDDRKLLAMGNSEGLFVWRVREGKLWFLRPLPDKTEIGLVKFSRDGRQMALASSSGASIYLLNLATKRLGHALRIDAQEGDAAALAFSPDGRRLAVASLWVRSLDTRPQIHIFSTSNKAESERALWSWKGELTSILAVGSRGFRSAAWSRDGKRIAFGGLERFQIHDARAGKLLKSQITPLKAEQSHASVLEQERRFRAELAVR